MKYINRVIAEAELVASHFGAVELKEGMLLVPRFDLPPQLNKRTSRLLITLPYDYPDYAVGNCYIDAGLRSKRGQSSHYYEDMCVPRWLRRQGFAWYCMHIKSWRPSAKSVVNGDNLLTAINALYSAIKNEWR